MRQRHILVADDEPSKLQSLCNTTRAAAPYAIVHAANSARKAFQLIDILGKQIDTAVIDFDFIGECHTGADIIKAQRAANPRAHITCATARTDDAYDDACIRTISSGANRSMCYLQEEFAGDLVSFIKHG